MASHLKLFHLVTLFVLPAAADRVLAATGDSGGGDGRQFSFSYNGFAGRNLTMDGVARVTADGLLMLTNGTLQMKGHAFYPSLVPFWSARSFSTTFVFAIFGPYIDLSTPGMAFFITTSREVLSTALPGQFLGLLNATNNSGVQNGAHVFAVELDTLLNDECDDISSNHVGINVDSMVSVAAADAGYYDDRTRGRFWNLSLISREAMQVWVDYDVAAKEMTVVMAPLGVARPSRPLLRTAVDLSSVLQSSAAYVGFSSATGILFSRHMVVGWSLALDGPAPALDISALPALPPSGTRPRSSRGIVLVATASATATAVFAVGIVAAYVLVRRRRLRYAEVVEDWEAAFRPHRLSYKDLFQATKGFSDRNLLGTGGFGRVYKGVLRLPNKSRMEVAVKRVRHETRQGMVMKEFVAEVASMRRLRHRNLVQLLGYCRRRGELLLVYDYMPNGSLDKYLHDDRDKSKAKLGTTSTTTLDWAQRFRIIRGVASGLSYLHEDWEQVVVHRDVKASNVLLDAQMNGRLGDFGLARLYDHGSDAVTTRVVGTMGYLAPELGHTGRATPSTDVFAFGAFLLEVTCGCRPIFEQQQDDDNNQVVLLVDWVAQQWRTGSITDAVDARLMAMMDRFSVEQASLVLKLGLLCSHPLPDARPTMRQVVEYLDGDRFLPEMSTAAFLSSSAMLERMYSTEFFNGSFMSSSYLVSSSESVSVPFLISPEEGAVTTNEVPEDPALSNH